MSSGLLRKEREDGKVRTCVLTLMQPLEHEKRRERRRRFLGGSTDVRHAK